MAKLVLNDLASLQAETSALQTLANNNAAVEAAVENTLSRDGTAPNQMEAPLDMNSNRLINLAAPVASTDAARLLDVAEALSVEAILIPAFVTGAILTNNGATLSWALPGAVSGLGDMRGANNLSELTNAATARTNLGLGSAALVDTGTSGTTLGLLDGNLTWSGTQTWSAGATFSGGFELSGTANYRISATSAALTVDSVGYRGAPPNAQDTTYSFVMNDSGRTVLHTSASTHTWTVPTYASVAFPNGTVILLVNEGAGAVTLARASGVSMKLAGSGTNANATLATNGVASLLKVSDNNWRLSGVGVS